MNITLTLLPNQIDDLAPFIAQRGSRILIAAIHPNASGWSLDVHCLPGERRDAIRAACSGALKLPRPKKQPPATAGN